MDTTHDGAGTPKRKYVKPAIESDLIYETGALNVCGACADGPNTGNVWTGPDCDESQGTY